MPGRWAVAITQPQCEAKMVFHAQRNGFECYLPKYRTKTLRIEPLFPRYVFVAFDNAWHRLLRTFWVTGVIMDIDAPATLPDDAIDAIRARCDKDGVFIPPPIQRPFRKGQWVRVDCGPMIGLTGIVQRMRGRERVEILISMLGRRTRIHIYEGDLRAA